MGSLGPGPQSWGTTRRERRQYRLDLVAVCISLVSVLATTVLGFITLSLTRGQLNVAKELAAPNVTAFSDFTLDIQNDEGLLYCKGDLRLINTGGAASLVTRVDVHVRTDGHQTTGVADLVNSGHQAWATNGGNMGPYLITTYSLHDPFPATVPPYGGLDLQDIVAEVERKGSRFFPVTTNPTEKFAPVAGKRIPVVPVSVGYTLHTSSGATIAVPARPCAVLAVPR